MWRLNFERGRQWWTHDLPTSSAAPSLPSEIESAREAYVRSSAMQKNCSDRILRLLASHGLIEGNPTRGNRPPVPASLSHDPVAAALHKGIAFFSTLQCGDGHWPGDYAGPMFLLPGMVIACYITKTSFDQFQTAEMLRYVRNHQNDDGGYGLHIEHKSTMFGTALNYVAMRLLGADRDEESAVKARAWIQKHGGAGGIPGWGKFWPAVLGAYDWDGLHPLTPEFWLLPYAIPCHPARFWIHCRMVYLPMSHLYGKKAVGEITPLVEELREELYTEPYEDIQWSQFRGMCCEEDAYVRRPYVQRLLWGALTVFEKMPFPGKEMLRQMALDETLALIKSDDRNTDHICIGPVNKVMNFLCIWFDDPRSPDVAKHVDRLKDYLWLAEDGMKIQNYNGSQLWDTAFATQAFMAAGKDIVEPFVKTLSLAHDYVEMTQILVDVQDLERCYRHVSKGGWPLSTRDHGWPIADCTGEGLAAAMLLQGKKGAWIPKKKMINEERLHNAVEMILGYQNEDGGWATYELTRGSAWLEFLNPSEVFEDIMSDYSYVECTASALKGVGEFRAEFPDHPIVPQLEESMARGIKYIESVQKEDGSWYGSWGICFLYAIWFAVDAYTYMGLTLETSSSMSRACTFVLSKQREDGGWGESYLSSETKVYTQSEHSQVVSTGWALLALSMARWPEREPLEKAAQFLIRSQEDNGDWPQQNISGSSNSNCMMSYSQYRNIFPTWALAEYRRNYL